MHQGQRFDPGIEQHEDLKTVHGVLWSESEDGISFLTEFDFADASMQMGTSHRRFKTLIEAPYYQFHVKRLPSEIGWVIKHISGRCAKFSVIENAPLQGDDEPRMTAHINARKRGWPICAGVHFERDDNPWILSPVMEWNLLQKIISWIMTIKEKEIQLIRINHVCVAILQQIRNKRTNYLEPVISFNSHARCKTVTIWTSSQYLLPLSWWFLKSLERCYLLCRNARALFSLFITGLVANFIYKLRQAEDAFYILPMQEYSIW